MLASFMSSSIIEFAIIFDATITTGISYLKTAPSVQVQIIIKHEGDNGALLPLQVLLRECTWMR